MAKYNRLALNVVLVFIGVMLIVGSVLSAIGTTLFPLDQFVGTRASVAGIAFGVGVTLAGFNPAAHPTWVRITVLYCALEVVYELVDSILLGRAGFALIPFLVSLIVGFLVIFLNPERGNLLPRSGGALRTAGLARTP